MKSIHGKMSMIVPGTLFTITAKPVAPNDHTLSQTVYDHFVFENEIQVLIPRHHQKDTLIFKHKIQGGKTK
jgi:hypothetical protein